MDETTVTKDDGHDAEAFEDEHAMEEAADLEARLATLAGRVVELESELTTAKETLEANEKRAALDAAIGAAGAVDPETVRVLVERAGQEQPGASAAELVAALKDKKPVLFREKSVAGSAMAAAPVKRSNAGLAAARKAAAEGDRASLLRYLRLRREEGA